MTDAPSDGSNPPHDHDHEHDWDDPSDLTEAVAHAREGVRSQVQLFVDALPDGELFVPLAEDIAEVAEGEEVEIDEELTFRPHMVRDGDEHMYCVAYTRADLVEPLAEQMQWETSGDELKLVCVPAPMVLEMALQVIDEEEVFGLVINAGTEEELVLRREEVATFAQGEAIPLVGYVADVDDDQLGQMRVVEHADPLPRELLEALDRAVASHDALSSYEAATTFDPERDREPHPTITLILANPDANRREAADHVMGMALDHLPEPGYADILFRTT